MVTTGVTLPYSAFELEDVLGNVIKIPYVPICSISFSFLSVVRSSAVAFLPTTNFMSGLHLSLRLYVSMASAVLALTYINTFGLAALILLWSINIMIQILRKDQSIILTSTIEMFVPSHILHQSKLPNG